MSRLPGITCDYLSLILRSQLWILQVWRDGGRGRLLS